MEDLKPLIPVKEIAKRYALFVISLFIQALGVAITRETLIKSNSPLSNEHTRAAEFDTLRFNQRIPKKGDLGVSPISSVANVMSERFTALSLGNWLIIWNCLLILGQILILRRKFKWIQLIQLPLSFLFGWFTDFGMWVFSFIQPPNYVCQLAAVLVGTAVLSIGVALSVIANVVMNSGEAFVKAISDTIKKPFGNVKVGFDVLCVIAAVALSMAFFGMKIVGTREGTVIAAFLTGFAVKLWDKLLRRPIEKMLAGKRDGSHSRL